MRRIAIAFGIFLLTACGGGGDGGGSNNPPDNPPPVTNVTVSGTVTFDRVPFSASAGGGLDFARLAAAPVRGATVEAIATTGGAVLATTTTDANGAYSMSVASNTDMFVRVKAEMRRTGTPAWNFTVRDNTASESLYALDGTSFNTGTGAVTRNLNAPSGWGGSGYTGTRAAAPFSILDAVYQAYNLVLTADANANFPELRLMWSRNNRPVAPTGSTAAEIQAQLNLGNIGTSFFSSGVPNRIYVLGDAATDTDEFDQHVLAHEWGHYYQSAFSRDDSLGGEHSANNRLDLRVAFSEGWGNAFAAMVKRDSVYRDSFTQNNALRDFALDVESNTSIAPGWFNEGSMQSIIYDVFDAASDGVDTVSLGFAPIHTVMTGPVRTTNAFTTVYPFFNALRANNAGQAAAIASLQSSQSISATADDFGGGEINTGGDARNLPIIPLVTSGQTLQLCSTAANGTYNKLGNRRFIRFNLAAAANVTVRAFNGPALSDPDIVLYTSGQERARADGTLTGSETLTINALPAGLHIAEIYEYTNTAGAPLGDTCFSVQFTAG